MLNLAHPTQSGLPEALKQAFLLKTAIDEQGNSLPLDSNVSLEEAQSLYNMVQALGAATTAEVGLAKGISAWPSARHLWIRQRTSSHN